MKAKEVRQRFIDFFINHSKWPHAEIPGASLIPENDPTVLFTTAGMHPLVPYLLGEKHPSGIRLVDCQKSLRTDDIDEVGDKTHCTFFEMMGNWSLGDYFKEGAIQMSYEFLTGPKEKGCLAIPPEKLHVSCFAGDSDAPKDEEAAQAWESFGFTRAEQKNGKYDLSKPQQIFFYDKSENWWGPAGQTGPCGPDSEMFYITDRPACENCSKEGVACSCGKYVEIWNDVFMQFNKKADGTFEPLKQQNVDTGLGLERVTPIMQDPTGQKTHFETELFSGIIAKIRELAGKSTDHSEAKNANPAEAHTRYEIPDTRYTPPTSTAAEPYDPIENSENTVHERIIADHLRAATFILGDPLGVVPSNTDQGYILRRLIRRAIRSGRKLGILENFTAEIAKIVIQDYYERYPELKQNEAHILDNLKKEETQFMKTLQVGEHEFQKLLPNLQKSSQKEISGRLAFKLYDTYGFPLEMTKDLAKEHDLTVDEPGFEKAYEKHQALSRQGAEQKFKGGLADHSELTTALHTATHLLHSALRKVLGDHVQQKGSNITAERLRFDFSHPEKMTPEQIAAVEKMINEQIQADLPVSCLEMTPEEAKKQGALAFFADKYGDKVKVYTIGDGEETPSVIPAKAGICHSKTTAEPPPFSREICGGPHVEHLGQLKNFKILKEESSSAGIRRIKAVVNF